MPTVQKPISARPVVHIDPKSFLGVALKKVSSTRKKPHKSKKHVATASSKSPSSSSEPSSGEPDELDNSSWSSDKLSLSSEDNDKLKAKHSKHKKCCANRSSSAKALKPTPYDGSTDAHAFHRFVKESKSYLEDSGLCRKRWITALVYFMEKRAYDFYLQKVSINE
ncbi:hypothetical protein CVT25_008386 [Psilocybe cyanescens]|uniref:Uncharacterized protein n=1 Tax=Psilocybe cyanescens TaxID=93625 RepID=A0A409XVD9_PSICY|nr:hypothetical protein CVT25_008386 [Psilocybe cyanescens]